MIFNHVSFWLRSVFWGQVKSKWSILATFGSFSSDLVAFNRVSYTVSLKPDSFIKDRRAPQSTRGEENACVCRNGIKNKKNNLRPFLSWGLALFTQVHLWTWWARRRQRTIVGAQLHGMAVVVRLAQWYGLKNYRRWHDAMIMPFEKMCTSAKQKYEIESDV